MIVEYRKDANMEYQVRICLSESEAKKLEEIVKAPATISLGLELGKMLEAALTALREPGSWKEIPRSTSEASKKMVKGYLL